MAPRHFAPAFIVKIDSQQLATDVSKYIVELAVAHEPDAMDHFSLTLANPFPSLPWTHTDQALLFQEGKSVNIKLGYVDDLQSMFSGTITSASPSFPESGAATLRVEGYSHMCRLNGTSHTRTFPDMTDKEIAQKIASEANLGLKADETPTSYPYVIQQSQTDFDFLLKRAKRIGFRLQVEDDTLLFTQAQDDSGSSYTLVWGHPGRPLDPALRVMPLRSFSPSMNTTGQVTQVIVSGQHPTTRKRFEGKAGIGDETKLNGAQSGPQVARAALGERIKCITDAPVSTQKEAEDLARAIYNERANRFITGSGTSIGLPDLRAGHNITLEGLGPRFSGEYYVTQTSHAINSGGYQTSFSVRRNALG